MTFVVETHNNVGSGNCSIVIPAGVNGQDIMFLAVASSQTGLQTPAGWALVTPALNPTTSGSGETMAVYRKVAAGSSGSASSDIGVTVTMVPTGSTGSKMSVTFVAWRGLDPSAPVQAVDTAVFTAIASGVTAFTGTSVTTTVDGCDILSIFMDKNSIPPVNPTVPTGYTSRSSVVIGSGSGVSDVVIASKAGGSAGNYGADTWNLIVTPSAVVVFTIALTPASTTQTVRPTSDVSSSNVTGVSDNTNKWANIDENVVSLVDWDEFLSTGVLEVGLGSLSEPGVDTGWTVAYVLGLGAGAASCTWTVSLKQGGSTIESWSDSNTTDNAVRTHTCSSSNIAAVTFSSGTATNLRLRFELTAVS